MSYLDKAGLTRLWAHILEKFKTVENKIPKIDNSLSTTGMAADAKAVGDALANIDVQDEIYIGSGEMPEGYVFQINPEGEAISGGSAEGAVLYTTQTLTEAQKAQARNNIGAASIEYINETILGGEW